MISNIDRRSFVGGGLALASAAMANPVLAMAKSERQPVSLDDPRLPKVLTVEYQQRDYEVVDYDFYTLPAMPRIRLRGPRFDPLAAEPGSFFTAFGSAHTLGVLSPVTYPEILASAIGMPGWNVGVGGISASFYNSHPQIIDYANHGKFAIVQLTAARMEGNDRFQSTPAAQMVLDTRHGDVVPPEMAWARIAKEEPANEAQYAAQSRASWEREYRKLLSSLTVPVVLLWFSARPMETTGAATGQVGSLATTAFPQLIDGRDVAKIRPLARSLAVAVTSRNAGNTMVNRFTGEPVKVNVTRLPEGRGPDMDLFEDRNTYYPSPEMHEDAALALLPAVKALP